MCGRYGFSFSEKELVERFDAEAFDFELRQSYNIAPTQEEPVIEKHSPNSVQLRKWGVQPAWSKMSLINAQASKLAESKIWKKAFIESRCIVPANWFYEWKRIGDGKIPYLIRQKNKAIFGFAGLVVTVHNKEGKEQTGYVIITTEPNSLVEKIHNRMPVILRREDEEAWLNPDNVEPEQLMRLLSQFPADELEAFPISSLVNSPKNNFPELTKEVQLVSSV